MAGEPEIVVDGCRVYDKQGNYVLLRKQEALLLSGILICHPRVAFYDFLIEWIWQEDAKIFGLANAYKSLIQAKFHLAKKLMPLGFTVSNDYGIGYRVIKLDSRYKNRAFSARP